MKKIIQLLAVVMLWTVQASAQTTTIYTGVIRDLSQNVVTSGQVTFELRPGFDSTISGFARFVPSTITCSINQATAGASSAVRAGNSVTISGLTGHSFVTNDIITVTSMADSSFNGTFTVGSTTASSITYPQTAGGATTGSGVISALRSSPGPGSCTVTMNTALNPSGTSYRICIQPNFVSPGSCFNDYAVVASRDITTVVPTPTTSPAYTFVDLHSAQTIDGNKTFTGSTSFNGNLTLGALTSSGETLAGNFTQTQPTAATAIANQSGFNMVTQASYWNGAASATDAWTLQDVLGTGSNPTSTYTLTHSGSSGAATFSVPGNQTVGGKLGVTGQATLPNINGILTVDGVKYTTIDAAMADCPSTGCIIRMKAGTLPCPTGAITKPIILEGAGPGGFANGNDNSYSSPTTLTDSSTTANCITIGGSLGTSAALNGVTIRDLAIQGNKNVGGATTGDGIAVVGGDSTTQLTNTVIKNVFVHDAKGVGISIKENVFGLNIEDTQVAKNGSHGIAVSNSGTGAPSQIRLARVFDWLNTGDGLNINGTNVHDVSAVQSTFANNTNGVNVVVGSTIATFIGTDRCNFEGNTNAGTLFSDGNGHAIRDSQFQGDSVQLYGVNANFPGGASTVFTQLTLDNNLFSTNVTKDINIASAKVVVIHPQQSNNYSYADASNNASKTDAITGGGLKYTGANGISPLTNGTGEIGDPGAAFALAGFFDYDSPESTAPSGLAGHDRLYGNSTAHRWEMINNNGTTDTVVGAATTDTLSNKTLTGTSSANSVTLLNFQGPAGALTGNAADQTVYTYTLPGNIVGAGKGARIKVSFNHSTGTASITYKLTFGGTLVASYSSAATGYGSVTFDIFNNAGVTNAQSIDNGSIIIGTSVVAGGGGSAAKDTTSNQAIVFTFNVANTDQLTPVMWRAELIQ